MTPEPTTSTLQALAEIITQVLMREHCADKAENGEQGTCISPERKRPHSTLKKRRTT